MAVATNGRFDLRIQLSLQREIMDRRRLDLVVYGAMPGGEALCCDATLVSPLAPAGRPFPGADARDGTELAAARRRKHARYPELLQGGPQRLVGVAAEVGGRWGCASAPFQPYVPQRPRVGTAMVEPTFGRHAKGSCQHSARCLDDAGAAELAGRGPPRRCPWARRLRGAQPPVASVSRLYLCGVWGPG